MITANYLDMPLELDDTLDNENREYLPTARSTNSGCSVAATASCSATRRRPRAPGARN